MKRFGDLSRRLEWIAAVLAASISVAAGAQPAGPSVARQWNEELLEAIRNDFARPTVHARNLFHVSVAMWDAWAAYDEQAQGWLFTEKHTTKNVQAAREEAISYACYRLMRHRFLASPGAVETLPRLVERLVWLGYDPTFTSTQGNSPAAIGNRIAAAIISFGFNDGSNEWDDYQIPPGGYEPVNPPLIVEDPGNPTLIDPNRWQPLTLETFVDQSGNTIPGGTPPFLTPFWGFVVPFSLRPEDMNPDRPGVYFDPGPPPQHGGANHFEYRAGMEQVVEWSGWHDPDDGVVWDISPASMGNNPLGTNAGSGYDVNPVTGRPYVPQFVPRGDYARVLAEFWADGPESETPPGHWNVVANYVSDEIAEKRLGGSGPLLDELEWDVKLYLALNGGMHDAAICAWGIKGHYDGIRPISAIRYLAQLGQCTSPALPSYHPLGIDLIPGIIELITAESSAPGERHATSPASSARSRSSRGRAPRSFPSSSTPERAGSAPRTGFPISDRASSRRRSPATSRDTAPTAVRRRRSCTASPGAPGSRTGSASSTARRISTSSSRTDLRSTSRCSGPASTTPRTRAASAASTAASIRAGTIFPAASSARRSDPRPSSMRSPTSACRKSHARPTSTTTASSMASTSAWCSPRGAGARRAATRISMATATSTARISRSC